MAIIKHRRVIRRVGHNLKVIYDAAYIEMGNDNSSITLRKRIIVGSVPSRGENASVIVFPDSGKILKRSTDSTILRV